MGRILELELCEEIRDHQQAQVEKMTEKLEAFGHEELLVNNYKGPFTLRPSYWLVFEEQFTIIHLVGRWT